jgi:hypothetical protein
MAPTSWLATTWLAATRSAYWLAATWLTALWLATILPGPSAAGHARFWTGSRTRH